ncbi:hypothetical protein KAM479_04780 [Aeromonas caviae]|nr:hypothetical protein KAM497c_21290 [Aeromonas caviae]GKR68557.1 hypothetical protein KAM479_04780 [Aeromonas caviae]
MYSGAAIWVRNSQSDSVKTRSTRLTLSGLPGARATMASTTELGRVARAWDQIPYMGLAVLAWAALARSAAAIT